MKYRVVTECPFCGEELDQRPTVGVPLLPKYAAQLDRDELSFTLCRCGGMCQNPMPTDDSLVEFYQSAFRVAYPTSNERERAERVFPYFPSVPGRMLDVGCSEGELMGLASASGWHAEGVEPNPTGRERASRFGPVASTLAQVFGTFDLVTASHVLEHVPDPVGFLREMGRRVAPGGTVLVIVPRGSLAPPHLLAMGEPTLRLLFERAGLTIETMEIVVAKPGRFDIIVRAH